MGLFCEVCNVEVQSEITMRDHIKGKRHLRLVPQFEMQKKNAEHSIFIRGFDRNTRKNDLHTYFSKFGKIENLYLETEKNLFAIVKFEDKSVVPAALKVTHYMKGRKLTAKQKEIKIWQKKKSKPTTSTSAPTDEASSVINHDDLLEQLSSYSSLIDQMKYLQSYLELSWDDICIRRNIQDELKQILIPMFPKCGVYQFGSSVNGFGIKGCDMDIYVNLNLNYTSGLLPEEYSLMFIGHMGLPADSKEASYEHLDSLPLQDRIKIVSKTLVNSLGRFNNIITIPSARCPVIKCVHTKTGIKCDITINNQLALRNTNLINMYSTLDERVRPLLYTIRYWAKVKEIAGNINSGPRFTNYSLSLLVLYYLQNVTPPVVPTVKTLNSLATQKTIIEGWDCSYPEDRSVLPPNENTDSIQELLSGFFKFCATFDFSNKVISSFKGEATDITSFRETMVINEDTKNFKINPICIQDPFVLNHNITANINEKTKLKIIWEFNQAFHKISNTQFQSDIPGMASGLCFLLNNDPVSFDPKELTSMSQCPNSNTSTPFTICIEMQSSRLSAQFVDSFLTVESMKDEWCHRLYSFTCKVLEDLLKFIICVESRNLDIAKGSASTKETSSRKDRLTPQSLVEEPLSEMSIEGSSLTQGCPKRHPSGNSDSGDESRKRHKLDNHYDENESEPDLKKEADDALPGSSTQSNQYEQCNTAVNRQASPQAEPSQNQINITDMATVYFSTKHRLWINRKRVQKRVRQTEDHGFEMEKQVTKLMTEDSLSVENNPLLDFSILFQKQITYNSTSLRVQFYPPSNQKEFSCFFIFFRSFFLKLIEKGAPENLTPEKSYDVIPESL